MDDVQEFMVIPENLSISSVSRCTEQVFVISSVRNSNLSETAV